MRPDTKTNQARDARRRFLRMGCINIRRKWKKQNNRWRHECEHKVPKGWDNTRSYSGKVKQLGVSCVKRNRKSYL